MIDIEKVPITLRYALKKRGLTNDQIQESTSEDLFAEYCEWQGFMGWGPRLVLALDALRAAEDSNP